MQLWSLGWEDPLKGGHGFTAVFLPVESHGQKSLVGYTESDMTEETWHAHIWSVEKWYWWTYLQGRSGDTDIENWLVDTAGEGESGMNGESCVNIYALFCVRWMAAKLLCSTTSPVWHSVMTWRGRMGGTEGRDICIIWLFHVVVWKKQIWYCKN